jgi:hypothetical protein
VTQRRKETIATTRIRVAKAMFDIPPSSFWAEGVMKMGFSRPVVEDSGEVRLASKNK